MNLLVKRLFDLCLLRAGPQDLPASRFLLGLCLFTYGISEVLLASLSVSMAKALAIVLVDVFLLVVFVFLTLWVRSLSSRFYQVLTACAAAEGILVFLALPLFAWQHYSSGATAAAVATSVGLQLSSLAILAWLIWNVIVIGHILRQALSTIFPVGLVLSVFYMYISFTVSRLLFFSYGG